MQGIFELKLKQEAKIKGYRPEMLEKVYHLLNLLEEFMSIPYLADRLVLKGGTAINLFCTNQFPRLSIDLDFNYVGAVDKEIMQQEKSELENILLDVCKRHRYEVHRNPRSYAGGKTVLIYKSLMNTKGRLEIDLNYLYRMPLWDTQWQFSPSWPKATKVKVLDIHELAAGKLNALLERAASRDLFDSHQLLTKWPLEPNKLRAAFTVYAGMRKGSWQHIKIDNIKFSVKDIRDKLFPMLKNTEIPSTLSKEIDAWAKNLVDECKARLSTVLPFQTNEVEFLERLQQYGEIRPELISADSDFCDRVRIHPLINWRKQQL